MELEGSTGSRNSGLITTVSPAVFTGCVQTIETFGVVTFNGITERLTFYTDCGCGIGERHSAHDMRTAQKRDSAKLGLKRRDETVLAVSLLRRDGVQVAEAPTETVADMLDQK